MLGFGTRYRMASSVGLLVVFAFLLLVGLFFASGYSQSVFNPPYLAFVLQLFFVFGVGIAVAFVSAKSYIETGALNILLLGNAILISSLSFTISATLLEPEIPKTLTSNQAVIIGNVGVLISSTVLLVSSIVTLLGTEHNLRVPKKPMVAVSFLISIVAVTVISVLSASNLFPVFLTSSGPTLLRLVVLALTTIFYFASSFLFGWQYVRSKSQVVYWFSLALALFGTAYLAGVLTISLGSAMTWVSRLALYLSGTFLLFALLSPEGKTRKQPYTAKWSEAFRSNQKQIETFFSKIGEGFAYCKIITDSGGKPVDWLYLDVNESYERINGADRNKVVGRKATEVLPGIRDDPADWIDVYGHVALTGEPIVFERFSTDRNSWYRVSAYSPRKGYFVSLFEDITTRKKAEEALRESRAKLQVAFASMTEAIFIADAEGNIVDFNDEFVRYHRFKDKDACSRNIADCPKYLDVWLADGTPAPVEQWAMARALRGEIGSNVEYRLRRKETGETWWGSYNFSPIKDKSGETVGAVVAGRDISEQKKIEAKLEDYRKNLERLVEERTKQLKDSERLAAIGATAGMVGHDIRNPLQAITSDVYLAKSDLAAMPEGEEKQSLQESLIEIEKNVEYINKIVQDLQDYARPLSPAAKEIDVDSVFDDVLVKKAIPKGIKVSRKVEAGAEKVVSDPDLLKRIMANLTNNAVQAMPDGGKLTVRAHREEKDYVITVEDNGVGIPEDAKSRLFTPLFTTKSKGQGFGLVVIKRITEALGGTISFESEVGKGTKFILRLPPKELNGKRTAI
jgi:PAS domain S-box-containing protein